MAELLIKASIAIAISLLFYKMVLQQESFFATNRLYLLGCLGLAFALPFISLPKLVEQQGYLFSLLDKPTTGENHSAAEAFSEPVMPDEKTAFAFDEKQPVAKTPASNISAEIPVASPEVQSSSTVTPTKNPSIVPEETSTLQTLSLSTWLLILYLFGVGIFTLSLLYQLGLVGYKILSARERIRDGSSIIFITRRDQSPCSFFNYIFIHPDNYDFETYEQIIAHEKIHVKLGHSLDMLLAELAVIVLWFNPLIWLFRREIEKNIEFQTDAFLLENEAVHRENYQLNLLQIAVPHKALNITTNYNHSLIKQRIIMMNSKRSTPIAYLKYAFLVPVFFGMLLLVNEPAVGQEKEPNPVIKEKQEVVKEQNITVQDAEAVVLEVAASQEVKESQVLEAEQEVVRETVVEQEIEVDQQSESVIHKQDMTSGFWYSSRENGEYCIRFTGSKDESTWATSKCFENSAFSEKANGVYSLTREAGSLELTGNLNDAVGQGKFNFREDASFRSFLDQNDLAIDKANFMVHLFFADVDRDYVNFLKREYPDLEARRLQEFAIHGIDEEKARDYIALFENYSGKKPTVQEILSARIHRIDEAYIREIEAMGFQDLPLNKIMQARIHGISSDYVQSLRDAGFSNLSLDKIVAAKIHKVNPEYIKEIRSLGFGEPDIERIIQLSIHNVDAAYIEDLRAAGLTDLSLDEVVSARIHRLSPARIKELRSIGEENLDFRDLLSAQIHGVNTSFVEDLEKAGLSNLEMDELVSAKIHGIDSAFIENARKEGHNFDSVKKYISLKIHSRAIKSLSSNNKNK